MFIYKYLCKILEPYLVKHTFGNETHIRSLIVLRPRDAGGGGTEHG